MFQQFTEEFLYNIANNFRKSLENILNEKHKHKSLKAWLQHKCV